MDLGQHEVSSDERDACVERLAEEAIGLRVPSVGGTHQREPGGAIDEHARGRDERVPYGGGLSATKVAS
jgi:hypothetical protein